MSISMDVMIRKVRRILLFFMVVEFVGFFVKIKSCKCKFLNFLSDLI